MITNETKQNNQIDKPENTLDTLLYKIRNGTDGEQRPLYIVERDDLENLSELNREGISNIYILETIYKELQANGDIIPKTRTREPNDSPVILITRDTDKNGGKYQYIREKFQNGNIDIYTQDGNFKIKGISLGGKERVEKELREHYRTTHSAIDLSEFEKNLERTKNTPPTPTGFTSLDLNFDGGMYEGIYVLGGDTGLGKTALALNLAENFSSKGRDVLYFSLEINKTSLSARLLSRQTYIVYRDLGEGQPQTIRYLTNGNLYQRIPEDNRRAIDKAKDLYRAKNKNLYIFDSIGNLTVENIENALENHLIYNPSPEPPIIIIDYLQILRHGDKYIQANDKLKTDTNLFELKKLANKYHTPILLLSSLNREGYKTAKPVSLNDFKDTGGIEYTADVILGLQLDYVCQENPDIQGKEKADGELPKRVRLTIIKNRDGKKRGYTVFEYEPRYHDFKEITANTKPEKPTKYIFD